MRSKGKSNQSLGCRRLALWFLMTLASPFLQAGVPPFRMTLLDSKHGLSESHVFCILQDRRGFLWFGTRDGLNRYDGYEMKVYRHNPEDPDSLSNNYIYALHEDLEGRLWIGTRGGVNCFDRVAEKFVAYMHSDTDPNSISHNTVYVIVDGAGPSQDMLWIGTAGGGLCLFDPKTGAFTNFRHDSGDPSSLSSDYIRGIAVTADGALWIGSEDGLNHMSPDRMGHFQRFMHQPENPNSLSHPKINALYMDDLGVVWLGTEVGVDKLDPRTGEGIVCLRNTSGELIGLTNFIAGKGPAAIWIGADSQGLYSLDTVTGKLEIWENGLEDSPKLNLVSIRSFYQDRDGTCWIGTYGNNIFHIVPVPFTSGGSSDMEVSSLIRDRSGELWLAKRKTGLDHRDSDGQRTSYQEDSTSSHGLVDNDLTALLEDSQGRLWIGTGSKGLCYLDRESGHFGSDFGQSEEARRLRIGWIGSLAEDAFGRLWIGSDEGLKRIDLDTPGSLFTYTPDSRDAFSLSSASIPCLYVKPGSTDEPLWIGTWNGGLNRMDQSTPGRFTHYEHLPNDENSLSSNGVISISEDSDGILWLGTTRGLNKFDPISGRATAYYIRDGLPSNTVYRILEDGEGFIWVSTPRGLSRFDPRREEFLNFDVSDGLSVEDFRENSGFREADGRLVFAGAGGWVSFDPGNLIVYRNPPEMAITGIRINNQETLLQRRDPKSPLLKTIDETDSIVLSHEHRSVELHFAALHYAASEKNKFSYQLKGFDPDWIETDAENRRAVYTNLDPGSYTFRVKGSNKDGVWAEERALSIVVPTPPWLSWWAYTFYSLVIASLVGGYLRFLHHKLEKQRQAMQHMRHVEHLKDLFSHELEEKIEERTRELIGARKKLLEAARAAGMAEIASDVLHNMGNTLNGARISLHLIQEHVAENRWLGLLERITDLLRDHREQLADCFNDEANGDRIPETLDLILRKMRMSQSSIKVEGDKLFEVVETIVASLRKQEEHVHTMSWFMEPTDLCKLLDEALGAIPELTGLSCHKSLEPIPLVPLDSLRMLRVLSMLIQNAIEAIAESLSTEKGVLSFSTWHKGSQVGLEICDNGVGITKAQLEKVFTHGFTTKHEHEGLGLHYSANAIKEMGGRIVLKSDGPGLGARVVLVFTEAEAVTGKPSHKGLPATQEDLSLRTVIT